MYLIVMYVYWLWEEVLLMMIRNEWMKVGNREYYIHFRGLAFASIKVWRSEVIEEIVRWEFQTIPPTCQMCPVREFPWRSKIFGASEVIRFHESPSDSIHVQKCPNFGASDVISFPRLSIRFLQFPSTTKICPYMSNFFIPAIIWHMTQQTIFYRIISTPIWFF